MSDYDDLVEKVAQAVRPQAFRGNWITREGRDAAQRSALERARIALDAAGVSRLLAEVERLRTEVQRLGGENAVYRRDIPGARRSRDAAVVALDRVRALRDRWNTGSMAYAGKITAADLTAALAPTTEDVSHG